MGHKNFEGDLSPPEGFVGTEVFVELSQSDSDFEVFVGPGAARAIWSDRITKTKLQMTQDSLFLPAGAGLEVLCNSQVVVDLTAAPKFLFVIFEFRSFC